MKRLTRTVLTLFLLMMLSLQASAQIWISNSAPEESSYKIVPSGMHKLSTLKGKRGSSKIVQWLRSGSSVEESLFSQADSSAKIFLFDPQNQMINVETVADSNASAFMFDNPDEGFYNLFYLTEKVRDDTLMVSCASREILNHSCRNGHAKDLKYVPYKTFEKVIPLQVVRERTKGENLHYFVASGEFLTFRALHHGKALEGVKMTLSTQKGWEKVQYTDADGKATFQVIQDYFTEWNLFDVRKLHEYLLVSEITLPESGIDQESAFCCTKYFTTYSESYLPAKTNYLSLAWSLVVFLVTVTISFIAVYAYRHKRNVLKKHNYELS